MPDAQEVRSLIEELTKARAHSALYDMVSPYLDEAERCFRAEAYRAAIVMIWCAVSARLSQDVGRLGAEALLKTDKDAEMLHVCSQQLKILTEIRAKTLRRCLGDRNNCAHPSDEPYDAAKVIGYIRDVTNAVLQHPLRIDSATFRKVMTMRGYFSPEQARYLVTCLRLNKKSRRLPHTLLNLYFEPESDEDHLQIREKIALIWMVLKDHLTLSEQEQLAVMKRLADELRQSSGTRDSKSQATEIAKLIFWEVIEQDPRSHAQICEYLLSEYERLEEERGGHGIDKGVLNRLKEHAPDSLQDRLGQLL